MLQLEDFSQFLSRACLDSKVRKKKLNSSLTIYELILPIPWNEDIVDIWLNCVLLKDLSILNKYDN